MSHRSVGVVSLVLLGAAVGAAGFGAVDLLFTKLCAPSSPWLETCASSGLSALWFGAAAVLAVAGAWAFRTSTEDSNELELRHG